LDRSQFPTPAAIRVQEVAVHTYDAQAVLGAPHPLPAETAALMTTREMIITGSQAPAWEPEAVVRAHWFDTARAVATLVALRGLTRQDALALMRRSLPHRKALADITAEILRDPPGAP
jgi:hypothetical protein